MSNDPWRNARVMYEKDTCARKMGIELIEMDDGFAQMSMTVSADMLNGHQTCHGGQLFTLADTAFAYACNSQGLAAVASAASIDFLRPAFAGDRLVATARVKQQGKLTGVYDIEIVNQQQKIVALFRGKSHRIGGTITGDGERLQAGLIDIGHATAKRDYRFVCMTCKHVQHLIPLGYLNWTLDRA